MIETRQMSFEDIKPKRLTKYMQILDIIGNREMTAREIETEMNKRGYSKYFDMNHVRPRLTELVNEYNELVECGTKVDYVINNDGYSEDMLLQFLEILNIESYKN